MCARCRSTLLETADAENRKGFGIATFEIFECRKIWEKLHSFGAKTSNAAARFHTPQHYRQLKPQPPPPKVPAPIARIVPAPVKDFGRDLAIFRQSNRHFE